MNARELELVYAFETHDVDKVRSLLDSGLDARAPFDGKPPIQWLTEMYFRSDRFPDCLRLLLERGAVLDDPAMTPVLLNDPVATAAAIDADSAFISRPTNMVSCFTPLVGATPLHVAAEFGNEASAHELVKRGADVNARAATNEHGLNGHTPIFHTVNAWDNRSLPILKLLLDAGARCDLQLPGITWGKGFEWETTIFDVTPISYCQFGLLPQFHRREIDTYANIRLMLNAANRDEPPLGNVPNKYLQPKSKS